MGEAYVPGLKVVRQVVLTKERHLPLKGEVLVKAGDNVSADTLVARTFLPGMVELVNVSNHLGIDPGELKRSMQKQEGARVEKGEVLAKISGLFKLFSSECLSPISGKVETISHVTGKVTLRRDPVPLSLPAFIPGEVKSVIPDEGVVIESQGAYIQGIFGVGGETWGTLRFAVMSSSEILDAEKIQDDFCEAIVVGGSHVTAAAIKKALASKVRGIIAGGIDDEELRELLGYDLGVAITGQEKIGMTLIVTEGFGAIAMADKTWSILRENEGRLASIDGRTQIRAGVIRPEIFIAQTSQTSKMGSEDPQASTLSIGSKVRIIRDPFFGELGIVTALPKALQALPTEAKTRVVELQLKSGKSWVLPRANIELVEES